MPLSAPAKPPIPASTILQKVPQSATKNIIPSGFKPSIKIIFLLLTPIILVIIILLIIQLFRSPPSYVPSATSLSLDLTATPSATPTSFIIPGIPTEIPQPIDPNWSRLISEHGGLFYDYPSAFKLKESTDLYHTLHPSWYVPEQYFDCINRQVGTRFPFPCWLLSIQLTAADPQLLSPAFPARLSNFSTNHQAYRDGLKRNWQINGPVVTQNTQIYLAEIEINQVIYQLETQIVSRNLDQYLRAHPDRLFAQNITEIDTASLHQSHLNLLYQLLTTFQIYRKPLIPEPDWLRHRFSNNWSVAYPATWQVYSPYDENLSPYIEFSSSDEGRLQGWYGNGDFVSFHQYSITLTTPDLNSIPPSATQDLDKWVEYQLSKYLPETREQIKIIGIPKRHGNSNQKSIEFETRTLLNVPPTQLLITDSLINNPIHQTYIREFAGLPPRIVTIRQLDGLYEPQPMQQLLDTFVKKIYE